MPISADPREDDPDRSAADEAGDERLLAMPMSDALVSRLNPAPRAWRNDRTGGA
jgi:hypothetical protein